MACTRAVPLSIFRSIVRGAEGALLLAPAASALVSGPVTRCRGDAVTSTRATTTVRFRQRTSLRLVSRMRATTLMHLAFPPPDVPALAGPADRAAASRERFQLGGSSAVQAKKTPGAMLRLRRFSSAGPIRDVVPQRRVCLQSNTEDLVQQGATTIHRRCPRRGAPWSSPMQQPSAVHHRRALLWRAHYGVVEDTNAPCRL